MCLCVVWTLPQNSVQPISSVSVLVSKSGSVNIQVGKDLLIGMQNNISAGTNVVQMSQS